MLQFDGFLPSLFVAFNLGITLTFRLLFRKEVSCLDNRGLITCLCDPEVSPLGDLGGGG